jgi:AraC-like DNA-binding protein
MLHSIPARMPSAPCFTRARSAYGPWAVGYAAFASGDGRPVEHRLLPVNFPVLILDFDSGSALLTGPRSCASIDGPTSWTRGVSVGLTPLGAAALADMPLSEISGQTVPLKLSWASQPSFSWLDAAFAVLPNSRWSPSRTVTLAWWRLQKASRVSDVAASLGVTRRRLERDFRRELGLTPGAVCRTARLQRSLTALLGGATLSAAAHRGGFADQPHLTRTMRESVGLTPGAFRALVQDVAPGSSLPSKA